MVCLCMQGKEGEGCIYSINKGNKKVEVISMVIAEVIRV